MARSANGLEKDYSNAVNGSLVSYLSSRTSNELRSSTRGKIGRGPIRARVPSLLGPDPTQTGLRPFPDVAMDFGKRLPVRHAVLPPLDYYDTRIQILDNISTRAATTSFKREPSETA